MDYGFAPGTTAQDVRVRTMIQRRVPATTLKASGATLKDFIDDLDSDASVTKPVDNLVVGTHASSEGFLFMPVFPGQKDFNGDLNNDTDFEILEKAVSAPGPIRIPDLLIGFTNPPPTHSLHIKGCNIGRDRANMTRTPAAPFLNKLQEALGGHVNVTGPKHFHGLASMDDGSGTFEYMAQEFVVRTKAVPAKRGFTGFASRAVAVAAFAGAGFTYHDGSAIPAADWEPLIPKKIRKTARFDVSLPLGAGGVEVDGRKTLKVGREFRVELAKIPWSFTPPGGIPSTPSAKLAALRADIAADARFAATHAWPAYERVGFNSFTNWFDGHHWTISVVKTELVCIGRRYDYTVVLPIVDRTVTPAAKRPVIFNFYPGGNTTQAAITSGFVESNNRFFARV